MSLLVDQRFPEGTCSQGLRSTQVDTWRFKSIQIFCFKIDWNYNFVGLLHHPFWLYLVSALLGITFLLVIKTTLFGLGSLTRVQYPKCAYGPYSYLIKSDLKWCINLSRSFFLYSHQWQKDLVTRNTYMHCENHISYSYKLSSNIIFVYGRRQWRRNSFPDSSSS